MLDSSNFFFTNHVISDIISAYLMYLKLKKELKNL